MSLKDYKTRVNCRLCNSSDLISVLKLASTPPANAFVTKEECIKEQKNIP